MGTVREAPGPERGVFTRQKRRVMGAAPLKPGRNHRTDRGDAVIMAEHLGNYVNHDMEEKL